MKRVLFLGLVLALMAILAAPAAVFAAPPPTPATGTTDVGGDYVAASLSMNAPDALSFGTFVQGWNYAGPSIGNVTFIQNSDTQYTGWMVTALGDANMKDGSTPLSNYLLIGDGVSWLIANGGGPALIGGNSYGPGTLTYTGGPGTLLPFSFNAAQYIVPADVAGSYSDTITFTASVTP